MTNIKIETIIGESIDIPLYDKVTVITGNSSSGKTKMINWLKACKKVPKEVKYSSIDLNNIIIISDEDDIEHIINSQTSGNYIFIDHYSFLENNVDLYNFIRKSKNIFIIMGHRNTSGLTSQDAVLMMEHDGKHYVCKQIYPNGIFKPIENI